MPTKDDVSTSSSTAKSTAKDAPKSSLNARVTLVGGVSDGKNLFLQVDAFDGEHTNRFYPIFPADASAEDVTDYMKHLVEAEPKLSPEVAGLIQTGVYYDKENDVWMIKPSTGPAKVEKDKSGKTISAGLAGAAAK